ncbi:hypothetical protein [Chachezhania antarctica]|uniref:hypothetical protein n=1 Tax=Chachezhania antarctica TaxID=2340860 RepID=UPI0013CEB107|nr:hypothetical protein [Chachezhania antarctica]|tara:strand:+ start:4797 stop:5462 length:666 start_codon:yes stop_codon:yes gene_type:complete
MDRHSRVVAILKVVLPLTALGLMSTVFLLSRSVDPTTAIPFAQDEIDQRTAEQQVTAPVYTGATRDGDEISVSAARARPALPGLPAQAEDLDARIRFSTGGWVTLKAPKGQMPDDSEEAVFTGGVQIDSSSGYALRTQELRARLDGLALRSGGPVEGFGPAGHLTAGQMTITRDVAGGDATATGTATGEPAAPRLRFTGGVRLIYDPGIAQGQGGDDNEDQ